LKQTEDKLDAVAIGASPLALRQAPMHTLFVHSNTSSVEHCLHEFSENKCHVEADIVQTPEQFSKRLGSKRYDVVLAEYPSVNWSGTSVLELLWQAGRHTPLIFLTQSIESETAAELIARGADDCVEVENVRHLSVAIRRAIGENKLREQRDRAEKKLRHSEARYRALVGNLAYGICHWSVEGKLLDVNQALVTMLGYTSRKELVANDVTGAIIRDSAARAQILERSGPDNRVAPLEIDWKRRDGTTLRVRLSGRQVKSQEGKTEGYEVIVEDVTSQRELENSLREQATKDSLTGLANYRRLVDVLDGEIKRSMRTDRRFALLLFDLNQLKRINDRYGHVTGSRALCRLADVLSLACRDIDTASRFGGDEFALVLPETDTEPARLVARRICSTLANDGEVPKLSVSVGVAVYPEDGQTIESLLSAADVALYAMKGTSARRISSFSEKAKPSEEQAPPNRSRIGFRS
jgi:diguanylate cyclase (GGDEF)-like protein/PAS domain S-box-containing protein